MTAIIFDRDPPTPKLGPVSVQASSLVFFPTSLQIPVLYPVLVTIPVSYIMSVPTYTTGYQNGVETGTLCKHPQTTAAQSNLRSPTMSFQTGAALTVDVGNPASRRGMPPYMSAQGTPHQDATTVMNGHQFSTAAQVDSNLVAQFSSMSLPTAAPMVSGQHSGYMTNPDSAGVFGGYGTSVQPTFSMGQVSESFYNTVMPGTSYLHQGPVSTGYAPCFLPYTPGRGVSFGERPLRDVPGLDNRRESYSTTATESTPGTPFFGGLSDRHNAPRVISTDRSSYTTPSPQQIAVSGTIGHNASKAIRIYDAELQGLIKQDPVIPAAVPAVFTTPEQRKSLEQCLDNRIDGNKNVYIRGLHPTTDDELLLKYASRFGEVEQSKAIIDTSTGACKGFGFAKFKNVRDSEKCIQGFYLLGYEVGFARESFNARLKAEGDDASTNLYISNLPKSIGENELVAILAPFRILSSKILRDSMGNSRGVGFARFESREVCEDIIQKYHGEAVGEECLAMQVRYADTPAQKELKRITSERRQYRTNEYNIGAYGTMAVGINPSIYTSRPTWPRAPTYPNDGGSHRSAYNGKGGSTMQDRDHQQSTAVSGTPTSNGGSGDEGLTIIDSPTVAVKLQSSPPAKKED